MGNQIIQNNNMLSRTLLESTAEDFIQYLSSVTLGELMGIKNYLEADFNLITEMKDDLLNKLTTYPEGDKSEEHIKCENTLADLYKILQTIENRHGIIVEYIKARRGEQTN